MTVLVGCVAAENQGDRFGARSERERRKELKTACFEHICQREQIYMRCRVMQCVAIQSGFREPPTHHLVVS